MNCKECGKPNETMVIISDCHTWTCGECSEKQEKEKKFKYEFVVRDFDLRSASVFLEFDEPLTNSKIDKIIDSYIGVNGIAVCGFVGLVEN
ncbi:TPA: hypothetical protein ROY30_005188 [Bacillus cereus]|uniref:hypothetical protein n=1 Tax=Bacillus sp. 1663tsa1 TaxID=2953804 RepID=UPI00209FCA25|nr:hypothetical protein [Bacillus sp. 1663tsa1]MCP1181302.1 hypothetical protein [Bacillus sp. 1663tsa1]MCU5751606.1 hypothetical protein [Bacillus cereus]HDX9631437.1 hypothetical protein [Bacillus cereus]